MNRLDLPPLPRACPTGDEPRADDWAAGFVDEAVVLALLAGPVQPRRQGASGNLALPADDMDFAGWRCCSPGQARPASDRRPAPPAWRQAVPGEAPSGNRRWWLAGLAGAMTALGFSALIIALTPGIAAPDAEITTILPAAVAQTPSPKKSERPPASPGLGEVSANH